VSLLICLFSLIFSAQAECLSVVKEMIDKDQKHSVLIYSPELQKINEVTIKDGLLYLQNSLLTTGAEGMIYVLTVDHRLIVSVPKLHYIHHSTLAGNSSVLAAGKLVARDGELIAIDNYSGHYRPTRDHVLYLVNYLKDKGLGAEDIYIRTYTNLSLVDRIVF
jgi:hypothetical protein